MTTNAREESVNMFASCMKSIKEQLRLIKDEEKTNHLPKGSRRQPVADGELESYIQNHSQCTDVTVLKYTSGTDGKGGHYAGFRNVEQTGNMFRVQSHDEKALFRIPRKIKTISDEEYQLKINDVTNSLKIYFTALGKKNLEAEKMSRATIDRAISEQQENKRKRSPGTSTTQKKSVKKAPGKPKNVKKPLKKLTKKATKKSDDSSPVGRKSVASPTSRKTDSPKKAIDMTPVSKRRISTDSSDSESDSDSE